MVIDDDVWSMAEVLCISLEGEEEKESNGTKRRKKVGNSSNNKNDGGGDNDEEDEQTIYIELRWFYRRSMN